MSVSMAANMLSALMSYKTSSLPLAWSSLSATNRPMASLYSSNLQDESSHHPYHCLALSSHFLFLSICAFGYSALPKSRALCVLFLLQSKGGWTQKMPKDISFPCRWRKLSELITSKDVNTLLRWGPEYLFIQVQCSQGKELHFIFIDD